MKENKEKLPSVYAPPSLKEQIDSARKFLEEKGIKKSYSDFLREGLILRIKQAFKKGE